MYLLTSALLICKRLGEYLDFSVSYLNDRKNQGIDLITPIIENAREKTLTFPGMICFGGIWTSPNKTNTNEEELVFPSII